MYSAPEREVGSYHNGMRLEVGAKFLGCYPEG